MPELTSEVATVNRDDEGDILPEDVTVQYSGTNYDAKVVPMATGEWKKYQSHGADFEQMNTDAIEILFDDHITQPDVDNVEDVRFGLAVQLLEEVVEKSGLAMGNDLQNKLEDRVKEAQQSGN
jgi:hypothetical protein